MVVPPKHPKMIIFSRKTHGFVGETHHFRKPLYIIVIHVKIGLNDSQEPKVGEKTADFVPRLSDIWDMDLVQV